MNDFVQPTACSDCPFNETGAGRQLRDSLAPGRFDGIKEDLHSNKTFPCHQTTGRKMRTLICAGALAYQRKNDIVPDSVQVIERIFAIKEERKARW